MTHYLYWKLKKIVQKDPKDTSLRTCPTDEQDCSEVLPLLPVLIPGSPLAALLADSTSCPKMLKSIPVASLTRECMVSLLHGLSREISVPCVLLNRTMLTNNGYKGRNIKLCMSRLWSGSRAERRGLGIARVNRCWTRHLRSGMPTVAARISRQVRWGSILIILPWLSLLVHLSLYREALLDPQVIYPILCLTLTLMEA